MDVETGRAAMDAPAAERRGTGRHTVRYAVAVALVCGLCFGVVASFAGGNTGQVAAVDFHSASNELEDQRQLTIEMFMTFILDTCTGKNTIEKVDRVLGLFVPDNKEATPMIDIQAPNTKLNVGIFMIKQYLEGSPQTPWQYKEGSVTEPFFSEDQAVVHFIKRIGNRFRGKDESLQATFEFEANSALIQKVTVTEADSSLLEAPLSPLDQKRQEQVRKYMEGRIEAFQGRDKAAGVAQVLSTFAPDGRNFKPVIDISAPKVERHEGVEEIQKYLENPPKIPCFFKEGSNTDPVMVDGKALVKFVLRIGFGAIGKDMNLLATYEFKDKSDLVTQVTVTKDE